MRGLKQAPDNLRKNSITDDFTIEERIIIKENLAEAVKLTEYEGKYIFKVRDTSKNGLRLENFLRQEYPGLPQ